ncbi:MAG: hypothetical protein JXR07_19965 [Reichenbachiella sp.]
MDCSRTFRVVFTFKNINKDSLTHLLKEIKAIIGLEPDKVLDENDNPVH